MLLAVFFLLSICLQLTHSACLEPTSPNLEFDCTTTGRLEYTKTESVQYLDDPLTRSGSDCITELFQSTNSKELNWVRV